MSGPNLHLRGTPKTYEQFMAHADLWKKIANRYDGSRGNKNPANPDLLKNALDEVRKYERKARDLLAKNPNGRDEVVWSRKNPLSSEGN